MVITPGLNEPSVANMVELVRTNSKRFIDITFQDSSGNAIDIVEEMEGSGSKGELDLEVTDLYNNTIYSEVYWPTQQTASRRIQHPGTGKYQINYGTVSEETEIAGTYLANWHLRQNTTTENVYATQVLEIVSPRTMSLLPKLRFMVDKTVKPCIPSRYCFLGFTDSQLIAGLQIGLCMLNSYQPYPCWTSVDNYDIVKHSYVLIKAAMYQLITSQVMFSIDTDITSFSDQGHSFVIQHFPQLMQVSSAIKNELDRIVPDLKRQYVSSGSLGAEIRMNAASYMTFASMPYGSSFKNFFTRM